MGDHAPLGRLHEVGIDALARRRLQHRLQLAQRRRRRIALWERRRREAEPGLRQRLEREAAIERLALGDEILERAALAAERVGQHARRRVVGVVEAGQAEREHGEAIGQVGVQPQRARRHRTQGDVGTPGQRPGRNGAEQRPDAGQRGLGPHVADHDEDRVVGHVPGVVELLQHRAGRPLERGPRAERVVSIRRALEERRQELRVQEVLGVGEILRHLLLDGASLLPPAGLAGEHAAHADRLDLQRDVEVLGGDGEDVLRDGLLRVRIEAPAQRRADVGELVPGEPRAPAEHHVLLRVRHAGEAVGRLVGADEVVHLGGHDRRQPIADDDDAQAVVERRAHDAGRGVRLRPAAGAAHRTHDHHDRQQERDAAQAPDHHVTSGIILPSPADPVDPAARSLARRSDASDI